ncbi:MAG: glycosyltransferase [Chitinophagia bacterium]|jgi:glycosyltransferase involved in cell wall biosynthesis|nr:glycosyltransferase [Chitinophagia bacterium]NCA29399.1 glycosyltransferase [Chitinophagia bacterium]NDD15604.1 glycosyltransferase [Chitinophagia bacterium]
MLTNLPLSNILIGSFIGIIALQLFYYLFFFLRLAIYKKPKKTTHMEHPISVVICARDEAANLANNLPGVLVQEYSTTHEVVLVNDNSEDETKYLLEEFKKSFKNLNPVLLSQEAKMINGKKFPLSIGIKSAKNETLLLTDADCVPASEHWMRLMQDGYDEGIEIVLGYGAYKKKPGLINKLIRFETFQTALQYFSYALAGMPYMGVGRNLSYKKEVFIRNKGFSSINQMPSGDDDLFINQVANKHNTAIVIDKDAHTLSEPKTTLHDWMNQKYRHYTTSKYYKLSHSTLLALYAISQFLVYPILIIAILFTKEYILLTSLWGIRMLIQGTILRSTMKKLNELDLWPWFILFDFWSIFYYLFTLPSVWKAPQKNWN